MPPSMWPSSVAALPVLSTALLCAEKGLSARLLEAEQIGYGGAGRNCGLVNSALWLPSQKVREKLGETYGLRPGGFAEAGERHKEWRRLGEPVDLLDRDPIAAMIGTTHFHGGLVEPETHLYGDPLLPSGHQTTWAGGSAHPTRQTTAVGHRPDLVQHPPRQL